MQKTYSKLLLYSTVYLCGLEVRREPSRGRTFCERSHELILRRVIDTQGLEELIARLILDCSCSRTATGRCR